MKTKPLICSVVLGGLLAAGLFVSATLGSAAADPAGPAGCCDAPAAMPVMVAARGCVPLGQGTCNVCTNCSSCKHCSGGGKCTACAKPRKKSES